MKKIKIDEFRKILASAEIYREAGSCELNRKHYEDHAEIFGSGWEKRDNISYKNGAAMVYVKVKMETELFVATTKLGVVAPFLEISAFFQPAKEYACVDLKNIIDYEVVNDDGKILSEWDIKKEIVMAGIKDIPTREGCEILLPAMQFAINEEEKEKGMKSINPDWIYDSDFDPFVVDKNPEETWFEYGKRIAESQKN